MKRKHLILLATLLLIGVILYAGRYALILRSDAKRADILAELDARLTFGMPEAEVRSHLKDLALSATKAYDATGLGLDLTMIVDYDGCHDALDLWSYMLDTRLGPTSDCHFVITLTRNAQFVSIE